MDQKSGFYRMMIIELFPQRSYCTCFSLGSHLHEPAVDTTGASEDLTQQNDHENHDISQQSSAYGSAEYFII